MLSHEEAFRAGFLLKCAEDGLSAEETLVRIKLAALPWWLSALGGATKTVFSTGMNVASKLIPPILSGGGIAAVAAPIAAGAGTGYIAAKLRGNHMDGAVEDAKRDEVVGEYQRLADEARRRAKLKKLQALTGRKIVALAPTPEESQ